MALQTNRAARVEVARQWFDKAEGSMGLLSWDDVDLVVQLGVADVSAARHLLLTAPDALFSSWTNLQAVLAAEGEAGDAGAASAAASPKARLQALTEWHTRVLDAGPDRELAGLGSVDLSRIARSDAVTAAALMELSGALSARQLVREHADEIAAVLRGLSADSPSGGRRTVTALPDLGEQPASVAGTGQVEGEEVRDMEVPQTSWSDFAPFDYAAVLESDSAPSGISFVTTDDERIEMTWSDVGPCSEVVLYRVKASDEYAPVVSADLGDLIAVTTQRSAADARGFGAPVRHIAVWANRGDTEVQAREAQPTLVASDGCVLPVRRCEVKVEDDGAVIGRWQPLTGVVRVDVLRLRSRVAKQTALYDPNFRLRPDQVNLGGFTDRDADPGEDFEYRVYVVARVGGDSEEMSQPVKRPVRVPVVVHPVTDLRVMASPDRKNTFDLSWTMPPAGDVEIYRTEQRPAAGLGDEALTRGAIERALLTQDDKLFNQLEPRDGEALMRDVTWPADWVKIYFTPVTVIDEQQIRVGQSRIRMRPRPPTAVRLVERVDSQFLTFAWPSGMTSVRIFTSPRDVELVSAETEQSIMELSEDDYRKYGGAHLRERLSGEGCAVHLVGLSYSEGRAELSAPVSVQYAGLARLTYWIERPTAGRGHRFSRKGPALLPRLMARCDAQLLRIPLALVHNPSRLPLFLKDGLEKQRAVVSLEKGADTEIMADLSNLPSTGFIRVLAAVPVSESHRVAVLDPSLDQLRCV
jgi:hypothetical protein